MLSTLPKMSSSTFISQEEYDEHHRGHYSATSLDCVMHEDHHMLERTPSIKTPQLSPTSSRTESNDSTQSSPKGITSHEISAAQRMLAACSGSLLTSLLVTPLDLIRVRLQSQDLKPLPQPSALPRSGPHPSPSPLQFQSLFTKLPPTLGVTECCREVFWINNQAEFCFATAHSSPATVEACAIETASEASARQFSGTWEGLVKVARNEGITRLWRGLSPTLVMTVPSNVIYFMGYDTMRLNPKSPFYAPDSAVWAPLAAGSVARTISATAISPLEFFRTRLWATTSDHPYRETLAGLRELVATRGIASLWRGLTLTLWRDVPFSGIYWLGYESGRNFLARQRERRERTSGTSSATFTDSFIAGATSGSVAAFLTMPFDVGKTKQQVVAQGLPLTESSTTDGMVKVLRGIYQKEGLSGLWRGCVPRMLKVAPACAIMISSYEVGKNLAHKANARRRQD